jgi:tRNA-specific 2-thiouridylase
LFVLGKDPASNTITVGPKERLAVRSCIAAEANWLVQAPGTGHQASGESGTWLDVLAKYRYNTDPVPARVRVLPDDPAAVTPSGRTGRFEVEFDSPQTAVAPGQAVVLYDARTPEVVLGGGWITQAVPK